MVYSICPFYTIYRVLYSSRLVRSTLSDRDWVILLASSSHSALARSIFFHPFYSLSAIYPTINETSLNATLFVLLYKNRKKLVKDNLGQDFREKRKRNRISVHIFQLRGGRTRENKCGSGARLNKKNSAGLISKKRTGERRWTKCKLLHKPR